jgi:hypothetical protein
MEAFEYVLAITQANTLISSELVTAINIWMLSSPAFSSVRMLAALPRTTFASSVSSKWAQRAASFSTMVISLPSRMSRLAISAAL